MLPFVLGFVLLAACLPPCVPFKASCPRSPAGGRGSSCPSSPSLFLWAWPGVLIAQSSAGGEAGAQLLLMGLLGFFSVNIITVIFLAVYFGKRQERKDSPPFLSSLSGMGKAALRPLPVQQGRRAALLTTPRWREIVLRRLSPADQLRRGRPSRRRISAERRRPL